MRLFIPGHMHRVTDQHTKYSTAEGTTASRRP